MNPGRNYTFLYQYTWQIAFSLVSLLLVICLTGCNKATPQAANIATTAPPAASLPSATPPPSAAPTMTTPATVTSTSAPTQVPSPTPTSHLPATLAPSTPEFQLSEYRLAPWEESDSLVLAEQARTWDLEYQEFSSPEDNHRPAVLFEAERLVRFPGSPGWEQAAWEVAGSDPMYLSLPGMRPDEDLFMYLVERQINEKGMQVDELQAILENYELVMAQSMQVSNLFGNGEDSTVFEVNNSYWSAVYGIHQVDGNFRLEKMMDWTALHTPEFSQSFSLVEIGNANRDGSVELGILSAAEWGGMLAPYQASSLGIYAWSPGENRFISQDIQLFAQYCDEGPCDSKWEFSAPDESGNRSLVVSDYRFTRQFVPTDLAGMSQLTCAPLERQRTYQWDGAKYALTNETLVSPPSEPAKCRVDWALTAGYTSDEAMQILAAALSDWPAELDEDWGPATRDYVRLQTGAWYELRGQGDAAVETLEVLSGKPTDPNYPLFAELATAYLQRRTKDGPFGGLLALDRLWRVAIQDLPEADPIADLNKLRQRWGFVPDRWFRGIGMFFDLDDAVRVSLSALTITRSGQLSAMLYRAGFMYLEVQTGDINGDEQDDSLILRADPDQPDMITVYYFLTSPSTMVLQNSELKAIKPAELTWETFRPAPDAPLITVVKLNDRLEAFLISQDNQKVDLLVEDEVRSFATTNGLSVTFEYPDGSQADKAYRWDAQSSSLVSEVDDAFQAAEKEARRLLFNEQDFPGTIAFIEQFLQTAPPEPRTSVCVQDVCEYSPLWYRPSLQYLLAVAYELSGQPEKALETYYHVWQDEPDNIFGMAASQKLEVK